MNFIPLELLKKAAAIAIVAAMLVTIPGTWCYQALADGGVGVDAAVGANEFPVSARGSGIAGDVFAVKQVNSSLNGFKLNFSQTSLPDAGVRQTVELHSQNSRRNLVVNRFPWKSVQRVSEFPAVLMQQEPAADLPAIGEETRSRPEPTQIISDGPIGNTAGIRAHFAALFRFFKKPAPSLGADSGEVLNSNTSGTSSHQSEAHLNGNPSQGPPKVKDNSRQPPAPPVLGGSGHGGENNNSSHPWRTAMMFTLAAVAIQAGYEAWGATWPKWVQTNYGITQYSTVAEVEMAARVISGFAIGWVADKFGARKSILGTICLMTAASTIFLFKAHSQSLHYAQLLFLAFNIKFAISSIGTLAQVFPVAIFKGFQNQLKKFNSVSQFIQEIAGIGVPLGIGALLLTFGSLGTMVFQPVTLAVAFVVFWAFVHISEQRKQNAIEERSTDSVLLRIGTLTYPPFLFLNFMIYSLIAIGYGNFLHPGTSPTDVAAATGLAGKIVGLYSLGGLLAMVHMMGPASSLKGILSWVKQKFHRNNRSTSSLEKESEGLSAKDVNSADEAEELRSTVRWLRFSAMGLGAFITFLFRNHLWAEVAMIPFGFTQAMSFTQLITLMQSNVPQQQKGKIIGSVRTAAAALAIAGLYLFGQLFKHFPANATGSVFGYFSRGSMPFFAWLGLLAVIAAYFLFSALRLNRYIKSPAFQNKTKQ